MPSEPWKFEVNTFLSATVGSHPLAGEILSDHVPKLALSATPPEGANVLVDVRGTALEREGMIKLTCTCTTTRRSIGRRRC